MEHDTDYVELVEKAQRGDEGAVERLAEMAEKRLYTYIYRYTLSEDLTRDIVQETILKMLKVLGELKEADRFWPWLFKIALNKILSHRRSEGRRKTVFTSIALTQDEQRDEKTAIASMVGAELREIVIAAMQDLKPKQRAVINMRCYEEMPYAKIAKRMDCSKFAAQVLFCRAKKSLKKQLVRRGFGKGSLLMALVVFGKLTAPGKAAAAKISVTAATAKVGLVTGVVGSMTSKAVITTVATAGVITAGSVAINSGPEKAATLPTLKPVESVYVSPPAQNSNAVAAFWYYWPKDTDDAMMLRQIRNGRFEVMQNAQANYHRHNNAVYIENHRAYNSDLSVRRLPTDSPELGAFLSQAQGSEDAFDYVPGAGDGLFVIATQGSTAGSWRTRHYNVLDEDYFQCDWPVGMRTIDNRDAMHKRGWTYLKITGQINGTEVKGTARVPFVYAASYQSWPWLKLQTAQGQAVNYGFAGFSQPWIGLHTIDTVRRDAAKERMLFETKYDKCTGKVQITLLPDAGRIVYIIDLQKDVIETITFSGRYEGQLRFSYLSETEASGDEFTEPKTGISREGLWQFLAEHF